MKALVTIGCLLAAAPAYASEGGGHNDPVASVALWLVVILLAAKLGSDLAVRVGQPAVLGELLIGVVLGNLTLAGFSRLESVKTNAFIDIISLVLGVLFSRRLFSLASKLRARSVLLALGLAFCFLLAWLANLIGLSPLVGAFAAGLLLEEAHYRDFIDKGEHGLEELIHPISSFLVPIFFVLMGMRTDLRSFAQPGVLRLAAALTVVAIIGKQACALGVVGKGVDRLTVAIGMVPRGEVGLIFANVGLALSVAGQRIIDEATFSAVVVMVIVTTMVTPPALKWSLGRRSSCEE